jgi:hypothetical protein
MFKIAKPNRSCYPFIAPKISSRDIRCRRQKSEYFGVADRASSDRNEYESLKLNKN